MEIRQAKTEELDAVLAIYERARQYMKNTGNPTQWGEEYPPRALVERDIANGALYVIEDGEICGVFAFFPNGEPLYDSIDGAWLNNEPFAAIHRVASSGKRKGILADCVAFCLTRANNLKIDTHTDNKIMQHQLKKAGFVECGIIHLENGDPRIAFQLALC